MAACSRRLGEDRDRKRRADRRQAAGAIKEIDLSELLAAGGVFAPTLEQRELFERVAVNRESGTVEWPGEVDLDPEVLYGRYEPASGQRITRRTLREPIATPS